MDKKKVTFLIIRGEQSETKRIVLSEFWIKLGSLLLAIFVLGILAGVVDYSGLMMQSVENKRLRVENAQLIKQFQVVEGKLNGLENGLERVKTFVTKLRLISRLDQEDRPLKLSMGANPPPNSQVQEYDVPIDKRNSVSELEKQDESINQPRSVDESVGELAMTSGKDYKTLAIRIDKAIQDTQLREQSVLDLWETLSERQTLLAATPNIRPTKGWYSSKFGYRISPFTGKATMHAGLDIAAALGTPIYAPADGIVSYAGFDDGFGKLISIDHGYGLMTRYGHCAQIYVQVGQKISRWDVIGSVGSTGRSTAPHLHYEVRLNDAPKNPLNFVLDE